MSARGSDQSDYTDRVIRRYANRKLYDSAERAFTTMAQVEDLVRAGVEVRVVDHNTGDDVTEVVLARALGSFLRASGTGVKTVLGSLLRAPADIARAGNDPLVKDNSAAKDAPHGSGAPAPDTTAQGRSVEKPEPENVSEIGQLRDQVSNLTALVERLLAERDGPVGGGHD